MTFPRKAVLAPLLLAAACAGHRHGVTRASTVRAATQCGASDEAPSARWIATEGELRAALGFGAVLGTPEPAPAVDFSNEAVLAVFMGQKRTAGFGLALHETEVAVADGRATLVVRFEEPPPGAMLAQVVTSPCLLLRLPRSGIREVRVVDPGGALRAKASLP